MNTLTDLLFHDLVAPHLANVEQTFLSGSSAYQSRQECLDYLHQQLNTPSHPIRQRLDRIPTASPDLLAIALDHRACFAKTMNTINELACCVDTIPE